MKKLLLSLALLLTCAIAQAEPLTSVYCGTGELPVCSNVAPDVPVLTYQYVYGLVTVVIDGVQYQAYAPARSTSWSVLIYTQGGVRTLTADFSIKSVRAPGSRSNVLQWTLSSGSLQ